MGIRGIAGDLAPATKGLLTPEEFAQQIEAVRRARDRKEFKLGIQPLLAAAANDCAVGQVLIDRLDQLEGRFDENATGGLVLRFENGQPDTVLVHLATHEAHALELCEQEGVCAAREPADFQYGLQTLCQLIHTNRHGAALPCLATRDWPSLRWRCFQDDLTRGPSSKLETLKFEVDLAASLKLNLIRFDAAGLGQRLRTASPISRFLLYSGTCRTPRPS
jgi:N-acetyl-beta-hexosaminidase